MLIQYSKTVKQIQKRDELWKEKTAGPISRDMKFFTVFDEAQRKYILDRLTPLNRDESMAAAPQS